MRVILDSNVLLVSISKKSKYRPVFDSFLEGKLTLIISNEILSEYEEIIAKFASSQVASNIIQLFLLRPNIEKYEIYFKWNLIFKDYDDNKFVDLAVISNADFIVTNDNHFNILKEIEFPKVEIIKLEEFMKII